MVTRLCHMVKFLSNKNLAKNKGETVGTEKIIQKIISSSEIRSFLWPFDEIMFKRITISIQTKIFSIEICLLFFLI